MRRVFAILFVFVMLFVASCRANDSDTEHVESEYERVCEAMLVRIRTIDHEGDFAASVIDSNGNYHPLPDDFDFANDDWRNVLLESVNTEPKNSVDQWHIDKIRQFVNEVETYSGYGIKAYEHTVWDYGNNDLYVIYINSNGDVAYKQLCRYGEKTQCIDKDSVRDFVNWMIENRYFQVASTNFRY